VFDSEQAWTVLEGQVSIEVDGVAHPLSAGDSLTLRAGMERQVTALSDARLVACGRGDATVHVPGESESRGTPPWIA
jgi:quercetin dioxygenase-like cupin family protein